MQAGRNFIPQRLVEKLPDVTLGCKSGQHVSTKGRWFLDKKDKKKLQALNAQLQHKKQQLAGEKRQPDDPPAIVQLEKEIAELEAKIKLLKND